MRQLASLSQACFQRLSCTSYCPSSLRFAHNDASSRFRIKGPINYEEDSWFGWKDSYPEPRQPIQLDRPARQRRYRRPKGMHKYLTPRDPLSETPFPPALGDPFELSTLLLDLDAEDAPGVRPFDEKIDGVPESDATSKHRQLVSVKHRVAEFEERSRQYQSDFELLSSSGLSPFQVTDLDHLCFAILPRPQTAQQESSSELIPESNQSSRSVAFFATSLQHVFDSNGIPHSVREDRTQATAYLLRRQSQYTRLHPSLRQDEGRLLQDSMHEIGISKDYLSFQRVVTNALQTQTGVQLLFHEGSKFYQTCELLKTVPKPLDFLALLNNVIMAMKSRKVPLHKEIYTTAFWASIQCRAYETAQHYLDEMVKLGHRLSHGDAADILSALDRSLAHPHFSDPEVHTEVAKQRVAMFSFLTGYVPTVDRDPLSHLYHTSVIAIDTETPNTVGRNLFSHFIRCLIRMGAFRYIWHLFHAELDRLSGERRLRNSRRTMKRPHFIVHETPEMTVIIDEMCQLQVRSSEVSKLDHMLEFTAASGESLKDMQYDAVAVLKSAGIFDTVEKPLEGNLPEIRDGVAVILYMGDIQKALYSLRAYLIRNSTSS
ncbi:hypothetical protein F5Y18DRAFT_238884 [Xylariaceae sp. FL1019]|nr:hypothetical protein F5Y18DRAFT_238884 [Xylariaceae sp. FL1019]